MRTVVLSLALIVMWAAVCAAGQVRGTIHLGNRPVAGRRVEIKTGKSLYATTTAKNGFFKFTVREHGKCVLSLVGRGKNKNRLSITIESRKETMIYGLEIVKRNRKYTLIKRSKKK